MITRILPASARSIAYSDVPASGTAFARRPIPSRSAYTTPAEKLTSPPSTAAITPCAPDQTPASAATAPVAKICQRRTVRMGLVLSGGITRAPDFEPFERVRHLHQQTAGL